MVFKSCKKIDEPEGITEIFSVIDGVIFCINNEGNWVIKSRDDFYIIRNKIFDISLLTLLEIPLHELSFKISQLMKELKRKGPIKDFPAEEVVFSGLMSHSDYWINLAIDWILCSPDILGEKLFYEKIINAIQKEKKYPQILRHKCKRAIKALQ